METSEQRRARRLGWYRWGVHALACVLTPRPPDEYLCPLCLNFFSEADLGTGVLTQEHVPPKSVGGSALVLTCLACNHASGALLDPAIADEEKLRTFGSPHTVGALPGAVIVNGVANNGRIFYDGSAFKIMGEPDQNNPATLAEYRAAMDATGPGSEFHLQIRMKGDPIAARLGWLRSAYLAAFAVYGYRYILQPALEPVRNAIQTADRAFDVPILQAPDEGALQPLIAEVDQPESLKGCRLVRFGPRLILLPPWLAAQEWYLELRPMLSGLVDGEIEFRAVLGQPFPERPLYLTDG